MPVCVWVSFLLNRHMVPWYLIYSLAYHIHPFLEFHVDISYDTGWSLRFSTVVLRRTVFTLLGNILYTWYYCGEAFWYPVFYIRYSVHEWLIKYVGSSMCMISFGRGVIFCKINFKKYILFHPFTYISSPVDMYLDNFCWQQNSLVWVCFTYHWVKRLCTLMLFLQNSEPIFTVL